VGEREEEKKGRGKGGRKKRKLKAKGERRFSAKGEKGEGKRGRNVNFVGKTILPHVEVGIPSYVGGENWDILYEWHKRTIGTPGGIWGVGKGFKTDAI